MRTEGSLRLGQNSEADKLIGQVKELVEVHGRIPGFILPEQTAHFQRLAAYQLPDGSLQFETDTQVLTLTPPEVMRLPIRQLLTRIFDWINQTYPHSLPNLNLFANISSVVQKHKDQVEPQWQTGTIPHELMGLIQGSVQLEGDESLVINLHEYILSLLLFLYDLIPIVADLNTHQLEGKDEVISAIVHAYASPQTRINLGISWAKKELIGKAHKNFVSSALDMLIAVNLLQAYCRDEQIIHDDITSLLVVAAANGIEMSTTRGLPRFAEGLTSLQKLRIYLALQELLNNAVKYTNALPTYEKNQAKVVQVDWLLEGDTVRVTISDQGVGIGEVNPEQLFERMYRAVHSAASTEGTGFGLSMARQYLDQEGGRVYFAPTPESGFVTTVVAELPATFFQPE